MNKLLLLAALLLPATALAEPLDYDYVYLGSHDTQTDAGKEREGEAFGGFWTFADTLHVFASWDDAGAYAGDANPAWNYDTTTLRAGLGGHYLLGARTMVAPALSIIRSEAEVTAPAWPTPRAFRDTGYGAQLDLRFALSDYLEVTAGARHTELFDNTTTELVGGLLFHPADWIALGALHHDGEDRSGTELTVRWYF